MFIKNNNIIKVLPGYDKILYKTNWISDKSRFSFDGMFSPEKIINSFLENNRKKSFASLSWQKLFKEFFCTLYFQNHLSNHFYQPQSTVICLDKNTNLEVLNLLNLLSHKYSFFKLRQSEPQKMNVDLEQSYLLDSNLSNEIQTSNICSLFNLNSSYVRSKLNKTRKVRYLKKSHLWFSSVSSQAGEIEDFRGLAIADNDNQPPNLVEVPNVLAQEHNNFLDGVLPDDGMLLADGIVVGLNPGFAPPVAVIPEVLGNNGGYFTPPHQPAIPGALGNNGGYFTPTPPSEVSHDSGSEEEVGLIQAQALDLDRGYLDLGNEPPMENLLLPQLEVPNQFTPVLVLRRIGPFITQPNRDRLETSFGDGLNLDPAIFGQFTNDLSPILPNQLATPGGAPEYGRV